ncbi:PAS domain S-box-containing protein [Azospirillum fermentarium]|uniref:PAS domain S-box protein n=1 Tax=Azospirillum fermentarium TaxID=1233114 RepID=UPI0022273630|nr:PAS domain S-box protein [Azospirillum fermentarium]MCW2246360.1 PAS domain S-box-containing protein [Azospirillum fermentarium]
MSILARLIVLILVAALPGIGIQAYHVWKGHQDDLLSLNAETARTLAGIAEEQVRVIDGLTILMGVAAEDEAVRAVNPHACQTRFDRLAPHLPKGQQLLLTDARGTVLCATDRTLVGQWFGNRLPLMPSTGNGVTGSDVFLLPTGGKAVRSFIKRIEGEGGVTAGHLLLTLDLTWLDGYLARHPLPPRAVLVAADREGIIIGRYPDGGTGWSGHRLPAHIGQLAARPAAGAATIPGFDGEEQVVAYAPPAAGGSGLLLALGVPSSDGLMRINAKDPWAIMAAAANLVLVLLVAWLGARRLIERPVHRLMRAVERWRMGDYSARVRLSDTRSELGQLGAAFDAMARELETRDTLRETGRAAERRMAAVLASTTDGVLEIDRTWRVAFMNDRARLLLSQGVDRTGEEIWALLPAESGDDVRSNLLVGMRSQVPVEFEVSQEAHGVCLAIRAFPSPEGLALYVQDVTQRQRAERVVRRAEARYRAILETAADAMVLLDGNGIVQVFNRAAERLFGYASVEVVGRPVSLLLPDEGGGDVRSHYILRRGLDDNDGDAGAGTTREITARRRDGSVFAADLAVAEWHDGDTRQFTAIIRDISERLAVQERLRSAKEEAERAVLAKSRFLAAASHDLRQPLQSLMFFAAAAAEQLRGHGAYGTLEAMQQALNAMKRLLDGLLDISRLDAGAVTPHPGDVALGPLLDRLRVEYGPQAERRGIRLRILPSSLVVHSDAALLERVLRNLLENALRYTTRGTILMGCRRRGDGTVRVMVCDTGIGIPPERQDEIFEEFTQLGNAERDREQGLGLGLAIVRRLCRLLGHRLGLSSQPGRGSVFFIDLQRVIPPAQPAAPEAHPSGPAPAAEEAAAIPSRLILVIDDEVIILMGLRVMLEGWGYEVLTATGGEEAIRLLTKHGRSPDAVIADYRLRHGHTGPEALRAIHAHCGHAMPSIVLTGDTAPERIQEAHASGFSIIHKPVSALDLRRMIETALEKATA